LLIPVDTLMTKFGVNPKSILHVGAHKAEEQEEYSRVWGKLPHPIYWIEGQADLAQELKERLNPIEHRVIQAFVWDHNDVELEFNIASNSQASSLLKPGTLEEKSPEIQFQETTTILTQRLDTLLPIEVHFEFVNLDLQGVELQALKGLGEKLQAVKWIYSEVNREQVYQGCTSVSDLDAYLAKLGFKRIATRWARGLGWGDALYILNPSIGLLYLKKPIFLIREVLRTIYIQVMNYKMKIT